MRAVLLCHTSELALVVLRALRANGVVPLVACEKRIEKVVGSSRSCAGVILSGSLEHRKHDLVAAIDRVHRTDGLDVVMAANVQGLRILHDIARDLPVPVFPMPPLEALDVLDDKRSFYRLADELLIPVPASLSFASASEIDVGQVSRELGYPVAVKPAVSWASIGFRRIASERELAALANDESYTFRDLIVQEYVEGDDVGAGLFVRNGCVEALTTFKCGPRDSAEFISIPRLASAAERIVTETACEGVINFDARLGPSGDLRLLECNPRFFMRLRATRLCGLDLLRLGLPGIDGRPGLATGRYRPLGDIVSARGLHQLMTGEWGMQVLARTAVEIASDPMPTFFGRLGVGRIRSPTAKP